MAKSFLLALFTLFFMGVMLLFAYQLNMLPPSAYGVAYELRTKLPFLGLSGPPSLEKYEGTWSITFIPSRAQSEIGTCAIESGLLNAHKGIFTGTVGGVGTTMPLYASTTDNGRFTGVLGGSSSVRKGTLVADIYKGSGRGVWNDLYECGGTIILNKQQAVIDPVKGKAVSVDGDVELRREGAVRPLLPNIPLYEGDLIEARSGSATLGMGADFGTAITLTSGMAYKVGK